MERSSYALFLAYKGTSFNGFARQKEDHVLTVQAVVEEALATVLRLDTVPQTVCAGRTDAGVHALSQVLSFEIEQAAIERRQRGQIVRALNALTPRDISIKELRLTQPGFSARFDAQWREYRYYVFNESSPPVFAEGFSWHLPKPLDLDLMRQASRHLVGEHDFRSFCTSTSAPLSKNTVREINTIDIDEEDIRGEKLIVIRVVGTAFLHSMVRIIAGTLCDIGVGKHSPDDILDMLAAKDRRAAGQTAPAAGLSFFHVDYPQQVFVSE